MKVKTIIFAIVVLLVAVGCNKSKTFQVTLNLDNAEDQTVYLCKSIDGNTDEVIDSAVISGKTAVLTVPEDDPQMLYIIKFDKNDRCNIVTFFTENQNTTVSGDRDDMPHWQVKGCPTMNEWMTHREKSIAMYEDSIVTLYDDIATCMSSNDTVKVAEINARIQPLVKGYFDCQADFVREHSDSYIGHFVLDIMKEDFDFEQVKELAAGLTNESVFRNNVQKYIESGGQSARACCTVQ